ncbi:MAG: hypothetical protein JSV10_01575 [Candidatus Zixiibacteriota bacterium]|nr:MAG: hypothetical protein JSV10_01575 [candidate division Zixibacteria bacterium]
MDLPKSLKSKKLLLVGAGLVVVILVGFFLMKFMTSGGAEMAQEKPRSARRTERKISKPQKKEETKSPLFKAMEALKDPFRKEDPKLIELQDKLGRTQKEIEYLKASLEEKKLRHEIREIEKSLAGDDQSGALESEMTTTPSVGTSEEAGSQKRLLVKAILITDEERSALLVYGDRKTWVNEGDRFDVWEIKEIRKESVVVLKEGKSFVFFYDRPGITREGDS